MQAVSLGLIRVPAPGSPVQVTTDGSLHATQLVVRTVPGFTGRTYVGLAGMDKMSKAGVIRVLSEPAVFGMQDGEALPPSPSGANILRVADYWVDADVANEGVLVTYFVA
jgi:hypothetical protein